jgi:hypothetical protein
LTSLPPQPALEPLAYRVPSKRLTDELARIEGGGFFVTGGATGRRCDV